MEPMGKLYMGMALVSFGGIYADVEDARVSVSGLLELWGLFRTFGVQGL